MPTGTPAFTRLRIAALRSGSFIARASAAVARQTMHQQYLGAPRLSNKAAKSSQRALSTLWKTSSSAALMAMAQPRGAERLDVGRHAVGGEGGAERARLGPCRAMDCSTAGEGIGILAAAGGLLGAQHLALVRGNGDAVESESDKIAAASLAWPAEGDHDVVDREGEGGAAVAVVDVGGRAAAAGAAVVAGDDQLLARAGDRDDLPHRALLRPGLFLLRRGVVLRGGLLCDRSRRKCEGQSCRRHQGSEMTGTHLALSFTSAQTASRYRHGRVSPRSGGRGCTGRYGA